METQYGLELPHDIRREACHGWDGEKLIELGFCAAHCHYWSGILSNNTEVDAQRGGDLEFKQRDALCRVGFMG